MGKTSVKENKNRFQQRREELDLTREEASELLEWITKDRIYKFEADASKATPDEVYEMSQKYKAPDLSNYYCSRVCALGQAYDVPEIKFKDLSRIVIEMLASLNAMQKKQERLIDISADGKITIDEIEDFVEIRENLKRISLAVDSLELWTERMLSSGAINKKEYEECLRNREQ